MGKAMKRTHGAGTVIARANGTFTAQITDGGRRSIGTFPSRSAAEKALAVAMVEGPPPALDVTFGEYLSEWLVDLSLQVKATTAARNRPIIRNWVLGHPIARRKVRDLKPEHFRGLYRELADHGRIDPEQGRSRHCHPSMVGASYGLGKRLRSGKRDSSV